MSFSGKATYSAGSTLPEIAEDVSDLVAINSPHETPLLDALGDPARAAHSTIHEWLEDALLPNTDTINDSTYANALTDTTFVVDHADRFRIGDQIKVQTKGEVMLVTGVNTGTNTLTVVRGYGGSTAEALADDETIVRRMLILFPPSFMHSVGKARQNLPKADDRYSVFRKRSVMKRSAMLGTSRMIETTAALVRMKW